MELAALLIFILSFILCAVIVAVVSWMGSKEKSYEEALEENKKKTSPGLVGKQQGKKKEAKGKIINKGHKVKKEVEEEVKKKEEKLLDEAPKVSSPPKAVKKSKKSPSSKSMHKNEVIEEMSLVQILSLVEQTAMDEGECQHLIDVLLNKQLGQGLPPREWVQNSTSVKSLQKQLSDKESELEESQSCVKSLSDKLVQLRTELNASTFLSNNSQRLLDDLRLKHEREIGVLQSTHAQSLESRNRECNTLQTRLNAQLSLTVELEAKLNTIATPNSLTVEVETLRDAKSQLESQIGHLSAQVESFKQAEEHLNGKHAESEIQLEEATASHQSKVKDLQSQLKSLEEALKSERVQSNLTTSLQQKVQELTSMKGELEFKAAEMQRSLEKASKVIQEKEECVTRLVEEGERLSEQLASTVERPKAEGQEDNGDLNGLQEVVNSNESWQNKYHSTVQERDDMIKKHERVINNMKTEVDSAKSQAKQLSEDLEAQRTKNNELREKNLKAMEALKDAELKIVNQSHNNTQLASAAVSQARDELMEKQKQFLTRLLPDVRISNSDFNTWMSLFEREFEKALANSKYSAKESASTISKLEERVSHYQSILSETENMLHQLESSVESEESHWRSRLLEKEREVEGLRREKEGLSEKNSALDESINVVKQAEEMQVKLHELQEKLGSEEKEKKELLTRISKLASLESDNAKLNEELSSLKSTNRSMGERIVKMDHIMNTGQEALQHEQRTVLVMRDQIQNLHKNSNETHVENGLNGASVNGSTDNTTEA